ncbi:MULTISPECIES: beta-galactosidase [Segatella]|uniref:Beta-galactosidase n=2 Tax=Segatella TaxID=2974251 RepID=D8DV08_9BACT|nr:MULTISPECIES: beta-galactosidase [Segatella]EFI72738.1 beta-galactosidase [Segatella baroniae B14]UKK79208.1 beta-galactosidase [Segatella baroniae B14]GJG28476.1 beta-galactosidase [Segatella bryantii]SER02151.1 beta-galactosidase [Segatella baroniae B14]
MKKTFAKIAFLSLALTLGAPTISYGADKGSFDIGHKTFLLNGKPFTVKAAELHYPRIPRPYWEHRIKMCKALGMNAICIYVFWNIHEQKEGEFNFTGNNDVAEFCRLAQKNGMYVIVRPGPYVCAEWEMGGLPWWLLKKKDIKLRERDPYFMERVKIFEDKVAEQLAPLTIQRGGPIIMVQVENEYGSYGIDKQYVGEIRDMLRQGWGNDVKMFQCDWSSNFTHNGLDDLIWTMNFGTGANIDNQFKKLKSLRPDAPLMCSEFWSGWFDKWGARHETRPAQDMVNNIDEMLSKGISFSLYMTHGGTSFGHWAGANSPGFQPDVTSYDYDAPINEYGQATAKYQLLRNTLQKYSDKRLPAVPQAPAPLIRVPLFQLQEFAPLEAAYQGQTPITHSDDLTFEAHDLGWGYAVYRNTLPELPAGTTLHLNDIHDYGQIWIDNQYIGKVDRVRNEKSIELPAVKAGSTLTILVEAMGRINFGRAIKDFKGITNDVTITTQQGKHEIQYTLKGWQSSYIDDSYETAVRALSAARKHTEKDTPIMGKRGYYRGYFNLKKVGDTFLDFETWGKGQVYVNGHAMGRIWSIGPQQTLYVPGCWLKKGRNEVVVLDITGPQKSHVWGQDKPELDKLNLEKSNKHNNIGDRPDLNSQTPVLQTEVKAGNGWQTLALPGTVKGRYLAIQIESNQDANAPSAIAEIYVQDAAGKRIDRNNWVAKYADSERGNHTLDKMFDLQESTYWQTETSASFPHLLVIDMGQVQQVSALEYLPRAEQGAPGSIKKFKFFVY